MCAKTDLHSCKQRGSSNLARELYPKSVSQDGWSDHLVLGHLRLHLVVVGLQKQEDFFLFENRGHAA